MPMLKISAGYITPNIVAINDLNQDMPGESGAIGNDSAVSGCREFVDGVAAVAV